MGFRVYGARIWIAASASLLNQCPWHVWFHGQQESQALNSESLTQVVAYEPQGGGINIGALIITYTILGVPYYCYSIMGAKALL